MIGIFIAAAFAAHQVWPKSVGAVPQLGAESAVNTGYFCKITGALGADGHVARGSTSRPISILVAADPSGALRPLRTVDPTWLLNGKEFTIFRKHTLPSAYSAVTSLSRDDPDPVLLTLQPLGADGRSFGAVIGPLKKSKAPDLAGFCSSNEGITAESFERIASLFGAKE